MKDVYFETVHVQDVKRESDHEIYWTMCKLRIYATDYGTKQYPRKRIHKINTRQEPNCKNCQFFVRKENL